MKFWSEFELQALVQFEFPLNLKQNLADEWLRINRSRPVIEIPISGCSWYSLCWCHSLNGKSEFHIWHSTQSCCQWRNERGPHQRVDRLCYLQVRSPLKRVIIKRSINECLQECRVSTKQTLIRFIWGWMEIFCSRKLL